MAQIAGSNLIQVKRHNSASIKEIIYKYGPLSRSQIAEMLSLTPPTITTKIAQLLAAGVVEELGSDRGREEAALGRRPVDIDFISDCAYFVGVEIAPHKRIVCITDLRNKLLAQCILPSAVTQYPQVLEEVATQVEALLQEARLPRAKIMAVGVGMPGLVESHTGIVRSYRRFGWENCPLAQELHNRLSLPVLVDNNTRMRAIGEDMASKKDRPDIVAYLYAAKGIACPLVIKNSIFSGHTVGAGELGHMIMELEGPLCDTCGNRGCLETYAGEAAVLAQCRSLLEAGADTVLHQMAPNPAALTMEQVLQAANQGDKAVTQVIERALRYLAVALANVVNFTRPRLVIVDAYLMEPSGSRQVFLEVFHRYLYTIGQAEVQVEFMDYDPLRGAKGAAAAAIKHFFIKEAAQPQPGE